MYYHISITKQRGEVMEMEIKGRLKSRELADKICDLIARNGLKPGDPILSEHQLTDKFSLSRVTVRQAIADLVEQDILFKVKGKGTSVSKLNNLTSKYEETNALGKTIALVTSSITNSYAANIARGIDKTYEEKRTGISFLSSSRQS
jgi:DNA-binding GntR family transcriptional regulator